MTIFTQLFNFKKQMIFEKEYSSNPEIKYKHAVIFAMYDKNGQIPDNLICYLKELKKYSDYIVLCSDCEIKPEETEKAANIVDYVYFVRHKEYDFGSYKRGWKILKEHSFFKELEYITFCNDSVCFAGHSLEPYFKQQVNYDAYGMTINNYPFRLYEKGLPLCYQPHIQSFFFSLSKNIYNTKWFNNFISNVKKLETKEEIIIKYEVTLSSLIQNNNFNINSYYPCDKNLLDPSGYYLNELSPYNGVKLLYKKSEIFKYSTINPESITRIGQNEQKYLFRYRLKKIIQNIFSVKNQDSKHKVIKIFGIKIKIKRQKNKIKDSLNKNYKLFYETYKKNFENRNEFIPITYKKNRINSNIKLIAFYLPQYHTFPENELWHGKGFTEWTNVTKAMPMYAGHHQPQLPIDVGFYDLTTDKVMYRQIELAKMYGLYGFCFHYYWFSGKRLMETPIFNFLKNKKLDFPFCLCWANENWTRKWDGGNSEILIEQNLQNNDWKKFANDIAPFLKDERYIKVSGKPIIIIYNPGLFEYNLFLDFIKNIRNEFKNLGVGDVHIVMAKTFGNENYPSFYNMDASVEFPPHGMPDMRYESNNTIINPEFKGQIFDMNDYIDNSKYLYKTDYILYKTVFPSWDNTARRNIEGHIFKTSPLKFKKWLKGCIKWTKENRTEDEQIVFINAWNEWAEGAHLEPDRKFGYAYLQAIKEVLEDEVTH